MVQELSPLAEILSVKKEETELVNKADSDATIDVESLQLSEKNNKNFFDAKYQSSPIQGKEVRRVVVTRRKLVVSMD